MSKHTATPTTKPADPSLSEMFVTVVLRFKSNNPIDAESFPRDVDIEPWLHRAEMELGERTDCQVDGVYSFFNGPPLGLEWPNRLEHESWAQPMPKSPMTE